MEFSQRSRLHLTAKAHICTYHEQKHTGDRSLEPLRVLKGCQSFGSRAQSGSPRVHGTPRTGAVAYVTVFDDAPQAAVSDSAAGWPHGVHDEQNATERTLQIKDDSTSLARRHSSSSAAGKDNEGSATGSANASKKADQHDARDPEVATSTLHERRSQPAIVQLAADATAEAAVTAALLQGHAARVSDSVRPWPATPVDESSHAAPASLAPGRAEMVTRSGSLRLTSTPSTAQVHRLRLTTSAIIRMAIVTVWASQDLIGTSARLGHANMASWFVRCKWQRARLQPRLCSVCKQVFVEKCSTCGTLACGHASHPHFPVHQSQSASHVLQR